MGTSQWLTTPPSALAMGTSSATIYKVLQGNQKLQVKSHEGFSEPLQIGIGICEK